MLEKYFVKRGFAFHSTPCHNHAFNTQTFAQPTERYQSSSSHNPTHPFHPSLSPFSPLRTPSSKHHYGFGIWIVLLVIMQPQSTNSPTTGWNSQIVPAPQVPIGIASSTQPLLTQYAISPAIESEVGIGVPSKYLLLPLASLGTLATVMLKRARRVRPQSTKKVRKRWSAGVRMPIAKAATAGETPNETYIYHQFSFSCILAFGPDAGGRCVAG